MDETKYYLVTYQWKNRRHRDWVTVNTGAATKCMGEWWANHLDRSKEAVESAQLRKGREISKIGWGSDDCCYETHQMLNCVEITQQGYYELEEREVGH